MIGDEELRDAIVEVLGAGVLDRDAITDAMIERGVVSGPRTSARRHIDRLVQLDPRFSEVVDGMMFVPAVVDGTAWTVWVDPDDAADGFVRMHPHLSPLGWWLIGDDVDLVDESGETVGSLDTDGIWLDDRDTDVVFGPDGWLDELAGGWASVEVAHGALRWSPCPVPPLPDERQVAALRLGFGRATELDTRMPSDGEATSLRFTSGDGPVLEALVEDRDAFVGEQVAPLPDLYRSAGLVERSGIIAEEGFDWDALRSWQERNRLRVFYELDPERVELLASGLAVLQAYADSGPGALGVDDDERNDAAAFLAAVLDDGDVAPAFWQESVRRAVPLGVVKGFANEVGRRVDRAEHVGSSWLRARCLDWAGDASAASDLLAEAVTGSCTHVPTLVDAAGFAADRGDASSAYSLLRRAGVGDDPVEDDDEDEWTRVDDAALLLEEVAGFALHRPRPAAGRNDACPCGSGRKYKSCHLGRERHSLDDRSAWLYGKATRYLRTRHPELVTSLADAMSEPSQSRRLYEELVDAPFVVDVALHEERVFDEFLAARSDLLPDDEALLAAQWALVDRGVFEIRGIDGGRLDLHDVGRGEPVTVVNTHPSSRTRVGTVMLGRPLPVGDTWRSFGGFIEIPRAAVTDVLDVVDRGDPLELAALLGELFCPPRLQNTDGHGLELHTIRWRVAEPRDVDGALRRAGLRRDGDEPFWHVMRSERDAPDTLIASVELHGNELVGEVNSHERADALRAMIDDAIPGAELVGDAVTSIDDALAHHRSADSPGPTSPDDPGVRAALAAFIRDQERRWLDEPIPALGGRTPRDAVTDPIGREQLAHLLDSFTPLDGSDVEAMSPERLRSALGL